MRKVSAILITVICIFVLIFSYLSWKEKIQAAGLQKEQTAVNKTQEKISNTDVQESFPSLDISSLAANMDSDVRAIFLDRLEKGETLQVLVVGSEAMNSGSPGYAELFENSMVNAYSNFVDVDSVSVDGTSAYFLEQDINLSKGYDVVILEPFTLNNNGLVEIEREHEHIQEFAGRVSAEVADAVLLLQPPQPIYGAQFYLRQVKALEEFALQQNFGYINHWTAWPDTNDIALKTYLTDSGSPAQQGAEAWATELSTYFIAK